MNGPFKIGLAAALVASTALPAIAQTPTDQYMRDRDRYEAQQQDYRYAQGDYQARRTEYDAARRDYDRRREAYERARADYDNRYGPGSYARYYGPAPAWDSAYWDRYSSEEWGRNDPYAGRYGRDATYTGTYDDPCRDKRRGNMAAGGLIGALAGAALGSNVAAKNARTEGTVLGAVVGGVAGAAIGRSAAKCDDSGYYYSYDDTYPYRESAYDRSARSGRYDYSYYSRHRCRLASAPVDRDGYQDYRYVRVCPDGTGRYRITG